MDRLPTETLHEIFTQLDLSERLECMLVSHHWYHTLHTRSLLYDVEISSKYVFDKFIDMVNRLYTRPNQVEKLSLYDCLENFDRRHLLRIFPNLRQLTMHNSEDEGMHEEFYQSQFELKPFKSRIEELYDYGECQVTRHLASSNLCDYLKDLAMYTCGQDSTCQQIVHSLKNMPVLTSLILEVPKIGINDVEILCKNLPSIEKLDLRVKEPISSQVPGSIEPAVSLKDLSIIFRECVDAEICIQWCQYMRIKYTRLEIFYILLQVNTLANQDEVYKSGLLSLLEINGPSLVELSLPFLPSDTNIFEMLDRASCKLKTFNILSNGIVPKKADYTTLPALCQSNQAKSIESLDLDYAIKFAQNPTLKRMEALEVLSVEFLVDRKKARTIDLNKHLQTFPTSLEYLYIHCTPYPPLDAAIVDLMDMNKLVPTTDTCNVISHPHLSRVALLATKPTNMTLLVPYSNLDVLTIASKNFACSYYVLIEAMDGNKSVLFKVESGGVPKHVAKESNNWPRLVVKVQSVKILEVQCVFVEW